MGHVDHPAGAQVRIEGHLDDHQAVVGNCRARIVRVRLSACPSESLSTTTVRCSRAVGPDRNSDTGQSYHGGMIGRIEIHHDSTCPTYCLLRATGLAT